MGFKKSLKRFSSAIVASALALNALAIVPVFAESGNYEFEDGTLVDAKAFDGDKDGNAVSGASGQLVFLEDAGETATVNVNVKETGMYTLKIATYTPYGAKTHNLLIGERTAEEIKIKIGSAYQRPEVVTMDVRGRNLVTGLPKTITVTSDETLEALKEITSQIVEAVHSVLEKTPPELAADVSDRGIVLTGGGSLLYGLEELIEEKTGITTMTAEEPMTAVAIGTGKFVEFLSGKRDDD